MARKRATFEWIADGVEGEAPREGAREDRKALKARLAEAEDLAVRMAALPAEARARLPVTTEVLEALEVLARLPRGPARKRQRQYVRGLLRDADLDALAQALPS